jgi:hypothetical protein
MSDSNPYVSERIGSDVPATWGPIRACKVLEADNFKFFADGYEFFNGGCEGMLSKDERCRVFMSENPPLLALEYANKHIGVM